MNPDFLTALEIMYTGMFGIFSVIIIITLFVVAFQKGEAFLESFFSSKKKDSNTEG